MSFPDNTPTPDDLPALSAAEITALPVELLAVLKHEIDERLKRDKTAKARLDAGLAVRYQGVPVGTIKRHATGKGNAPKQAMIDAARARGFSPADDNEADAIAILLWAIETRGGVA